MRRHDELMERLAAADPVRDPEELTPEDQREADALLARLLATPVEPAAEPRRPRSQLRRRRWRWPARRAPCWRALSRSTSSTPTRRGPQWSTGRWRR